MHFLAHFWTYKTRGTFKPPKGFFSTHQISAKWCYIRRRIGWGWCGNYNPNFSIDGWVVLQTTVPTVGLSSSRRACNALHRHQPHVQAYAPNSANNADSFVSNSSMHPDAHWGTLTVHFCIHKPLQCYRLSIPSIQ